MTHAQFLFFDSFRNDFMQQIKLWNSMVPDLQKLQKEAADAAKTPEYNLQTPIVYNRALDSITEEDEIKLIVIGDNPGKDEQLLKNNRYLVGQAGKLGERFFRLNPELETDFRKNVIILNKTPVHSAKTSQLKHMIKNGGKPVQNLIDDTQVWMAEKTCQLAKELGAEIWLVGYSELKERGIFKLYREVMRKNAPFEKLFVFQHFSMNRFTVDLADFRKHHSQLSLKDALCALGTLHKNEIFTQE